MKLSDCRSWVRTSLCFLLAFSLLVQGCFPKRDGGKGSRKGGSPQVEKKPSIPKARGGLAITNPRWGFVGKSISLVRGTAPAGSRVYLLDGPAPIGEGASDDNGSFSIAVSALGEGTHLLRADATGIGSSSVVKVTVDTVAPTVSFMETPPAAVSEPYAKFRWQASEDPALYSYKLEDQAALPFALSDRIGLNALSPGSHTFTVVARDLAGNQGQPASVTFTYQPPGHEKLTNLVIAPNPFNPLEERTTISGTMADGIAHDWRIEIKAANGMFVQTFSGQGTSLQASWDGKNSAGVPQAVGTYAAEIAVEGATRSFPIHVTAWKAGYLNQDETELKLPAPGISLELNRRYRSDRANEIGSFGRGFFSDVLDTKVTVDHSKLPVTFKTPSEQKMTFPFKREFAGGTGTFKATWAAPGGHLFKDRTAPSYVIDLRNDPKNPEYVDPDLEDYKPGSFDWTQRGGDRMGFSTVQGIEYRKDPNGNQVTYTPTAIAHSNGRAIAFGRDEAGRIVQSKDPNGNITTYSYNAEGHLIAVTDPIGTTRTLSYDASRRLIAEKAFDGTPVARFTYDASGNPLAARDSLDHALGFGHGPNQDRIFDRGGMAVTRALHADGTVAAVTSPLGDRTAYRYDRRGLPDRIEHSLGLVETLSYDSAGDLSERTDLYGNVSKFTYDSAGRILTSSVEGYRWSYTYDSRGNILEKSQTLPTGSSETYRYSYDDRGNVLTEKDPKGELTTHRYDLAGNRTKTVLSDGSTAEYAYDANGNLLSEKLLGPDHALIESVGYAYDPGNRLSKVVTPQQTVELVRDGHHNLTAVTYVLPDGTIKTEGFTTTPRKDLLGWQEASGTKHRYEVDPNGLILQEDVDGEPVAYHQYDELGRLVRTVLPDGEFEYRAYDALNRVIESGSSKIPATRLTYDARGRIATEMVDGVRKAFTYDVNGRRVRVVTSSAAGAVTADYDSNGRLVFLTDASGATTSYGYDAKGNLVKVSEPNPKGGAPLETIYTVDEKGNRLTQTDAKGRVTSWTYDAEGRVTSRTLPMGQTEKFFYNTEGQRVRHQKFDGGVIGYAYAPSGKLSKKVYPDGDMVMWVYDSDGRLAEILDYRGSTKRVYDSRSKLAAVVDPRNHIMGYDYDPADRVTRIGLAAGETRYGFDDQGRLSWVKDPSGKATRYTYDRAPGSTRRMRIDHGNGTVETFEYDSAGRLSRLGHKDGVGKMLRDFQYKRDAMGRVTKVVEESGRTVEYAYDSRGMLLREKITKTGGAVEDREYLVDEVGNRVQKTARTPSGTVVTNYAYDANDRLLSEETAGQVRAYQYDENGNTTVKKGSNDSAVYRYDFEDRLRGAQVTQGGQTMDLAFAYDPEGIRTGKTVNGFPIDYVVDTNRTYSQVVAEYRAGQLWAMVTGADRGEQGNEMISSRIGLNRYDYHQDGMNRSVRLVTDDGQNVAERRDYDAFGNGLEMNPAGWFVHPYGFAGEEFDAHLGMTYNRARYYDPTVGRFHTMDPYQGNPYDPLSLHKYIFAHNDPVNRIDPSGRFEWSLAGQLVTMAMRGILNAIVLGIKAELFLWAAHGAALAAHGVAIVLESILDQFMDSDLSDATGRLVGFLDSLHVRTMPDFLWAMAGGLVFAGLGRLLRPVIQRIVPWMRSMYGSARVAFGNLLRGPAAEGVRAAFRAAFRALYRGRSLRVPAGEIRCIGSELVIPLDRIAASGNYLMGLIKHAPGTIDKMVDEMIIPGSHDLVVGGINLIRTSQHESLKELSRLLLGVHYDLERNLNGFLRIAVYDADKLSESTLFAPCRDYLRNGMGLFIDVDVNQVYVLINKTELIDGSDLKKKIAMILAHEGEHLIDHIVKRVLPAARFFNNPVTHGEAFTARLLPKVERRGLVEEVNSWLTTHAFGKEIGYPWFPDSERARSVYDKTYPPIADVLFEMYQVFETYGDDLPPMYGIYDQARAVMIREINEVFGFTYIR